MPTDERKYRLLQGYERADDVLIQHAQRAQHAGCPVIVVTLDVVSPLKWETLARLRRIDTRQCGTDLRGVTGITAPNLTWDFITRLRASIKAKIVLKGILTREDTKLAADNGIDGIIVSNHGGRVIDSGRATIEVLPEIIEAVGGRMPVLVDSGFRRGTDIIKALALGAQAVCIGRPYLWGLAAFGQLGVERVLEILRAEARAAMQQVGAPANKGSYPGGGAAGLRCG